MGPVTGRIQQMASSPGNHLLAEVNERLNHVTQVHLLRSAGIQGQQINPERGLQLREAI